MLEDRSIEVFGLGQLSLQNGFLLMFAGSQRCDSIEPDQDAQCIMNRGPIDPRSERDRGLRLCVAGPQQAPSVNECDSTTPPDPSRFCKAVIAPPTEHCDVIELLTLRRWIAPEGNQAFLEIRRDGRSVHRDAMDGSMLDGDVDLLRIGDAPRRTFFGEGALVALLTGTFDESATCRLERFVLQRLQAAGLRETFEPPDGCD